MWKLALILAFVLTALLPTGAKGQNRALAIDDLIGSYTHSGQFAGSTITIERESKFHINAGDCTQEYFEAGTYEFKAGVVYFTTTKHTVKSHGESDEEAKDLLDPKVFKELYDDDPPADYKTDELVPVKWGDRLYLLRKDSFAEFCNAINLGLEPRNELGSDWYLGSFYLRKGDESKSVTGRPSLPDNLLGLLLEQPVDSEITSILREGDSEIAVIGKGSEAGLKRGMRLVINENELGEGPTLWSGLVVISAEPHLAKLTILGKANIGDKVNSRFLDRRRQQN
jgi:hypothetical protein